MHWLDHICCFYMFWHVMSFVSLTFLPIDLNQLFLSLHMVSMCWSRTCQYQSQIHLGRGNQKCRWKESSIRILFRKQWCKIDKPYINTTSWIKLCNNIYITHPCNWNSWVPCWAPSFALSERNSSKQMRSWNCIAQLFCNHHTSSRCQNVCSNIGHHTHTYFSHMLKKALGKQG